MEVWLDTACSFGYVVSLYLPHIYNTRLNRGKIYSGTVLTDISRVHLDLLTEVILEISKCKWNKNYSRTETGTVQRAVICILVADWSLIIYVFMPELELIKSVCLFNSVG